MHTLGEPHFQLSARVTEGCEFTYSRRRLRLWAFLLAALISVWMAFGPVYSSSAGAFSATMAEVSGDNVYRIYKVYAVIVAVSALPLVWKPLRFGAGFLLVFFGCIHQPLYLFPGALMFIVLPFTHIRVFGYQARAIPS